MAIERLVYNKDQKNPNPYNLGYEDNGERKIIAANTSIGEVLAAGGEKLMQKDSVMHGSIFRMGWNTAAVFEKQPNGPLKINRVYDITTCKEKDIQYLSGITFNQITTQAIDTCTLFYIDTDNKCLLAHFEPNQVVNFEALLKGITFPVTNSDYVFYSGGGARAYQRIRGDEDNSIKGSYNRLVQWARQRTLIVFDRMVGFYDKETNCDHFSHMEFGIGWDGKTATYFGDIIYSNDENVSATSCPCHTFECNRIENLSDMKVWARSLTVSDVGLGVDSLEEA